MRIFDLISRWLALRRAQRRWRETRTLLLVVMACVLCHMISLFCAAAAYVVQQLRLLL